MHNKLVCGPRFLGITGYCLRERSEESVSCEICVVELDIRLQWQPRGAYRRGYVQGRRSWTITCGCLTDREQVQFVSY